MGFQFPFDPLPGQRIITPEGVVFQYASGGWVLSATDTWPPASAPGEYISFPVYPILGDTFTTPSGLAFFYIGDDAWQIIGTAPIPSPYFLAGSGPPPNVMGFEGNYYLDVTSGEIYGP